MRHASGPGVGEKIDAGQVDGAHVRFLDVQVRGAGRDATVEPRS